MKIKLNILSDTANYNDTILNDEMDVVYHL